MFRRVIVPLDGSELSEQALDYAAAIAVKFNAPVTLLRAYDGPERSAQLLAMMQSQPGPGGMVDPVTVNTVTRAAQAEGQEAQAYLDSRARALAARGLKVDTRVVDAPATDAILDTAMAGPDALIIMSSHGRGGLGRLVFGSVAQDVLHKARVPVFFIRVEEAGAVPASAGGSGSMDISIGSEVVGTHGKLGEVHRVIADARSDKVTDLVVKHGFAFGRERIVPLGHVTRVANGVVYLDLDEKQLEGMDAFTEERLRGPNPDYVGPPDADLEGTHRGNMTMDQMIAAGPLGAYGAAGKPMGYPGGEPLTPDDMSRAAITRGVEVVDVNGEKVGEVGELSVSSAGGAATRLVLRRGLIFKQDIDVPLGWIQDLSDEGVVLNVPKSEVESLTRQR